MKERIAIYHYDCLPLSETFIYRQLQGLRDAFELKVLTHAVHNLSEFPGLAPIPIPHQGFLGRCLGLQNRFLRRELQGYQLLHVNFGHVALAMQRPAHRSGIPLTAYFLGVDASAFLKDPAYRDKLHRASFETVFVNSRDMQRRLAPHLPPGCPCLVVYCGIPLKLFPFRHRRQVPDGALFLQVSRLEEKKGVEVTLRAFKKYHSETDPRARLIIAGEGPLRGCLQALAHNLGLDLHHEVRFIGAIGYHEYRELLQKADVYLQPSITAQDGDMEGLPTAICEAMASGLPVVATWHSGIPEVVEDGETGFLAAERDYIGLYERMVQLRRHCDVGALSFAARRKIEAQFDHTVTIAALSQHLRGIIKGESGGS